MKKGEPNWVTNLFNRLGIKEAGHVNMDLHDHEDEVCSCILQGHMLEEGDGAELLGKLIAEVNRDPATVSIASPKYKDLRSMLSGSGGELLSRFYKKKGILLTIKASSLTIGKVENESRSTPSVNGKKKSKKLESIA